MRTMSASVASHSAYWLSTAWVTASTSLIAPTVPMASTSSRGAFPPTRARVADPHGHLADRRPGRARARRVPHGGAPAPVRTPRPSRARAIQRSMGPPDLTFRIRPDGPTRPAPNIAPRERLGAVGQARRGRRLARLHADGVLHGERARHRRVG